MINELDNKMRLFFKSPDDFVGRTGRHSTLYLLRRDVSLCFGIDPNSGNKVDFVALFPGAMAILAGIDLLAKFVYGDSGSVSIRYKSYVNRYISKEYSEELYQLRNALIHSFGLYSESFKKEKYHFVLVRGSNQFVQRKIGFSYFVDVDILWRYFENSISLYKKDLITSDKCKLIFEEMFSKYGVVRVGQ